MSTVGANWNRTFPYQLLILKRVSGKWMKAEDVPTPEFTLPIPPQTLSIDMEFASVVEATQGGIVEQHNGAPFRDITLQGTTGVLPLRGVAERSSPTPLGSLAEGVFAGTVRAAQSLVQASGASQPQQNVISDEAFKGLDADSPAYGTGYYQFLLLKRFLEWYANAKKSKTYQDYTLGFAIWKEREVYLVTPRRFVVNRQAGKALQYPYALMLRAWGRVTLESGVLGDVSVEHLPARDPNMLADVLNAIEKARRTIENATDLVKAVSADVTNTVMGPLRQTSLFVKDALGVGYAVMDFPTFIPQLEKSIKNTLQTFGQAPTVETVAKRLGVTHGESSEIDSALQELVAELAVSNGAGSLFATPTKFPNFWAQVKIDRLKLPFVFTDAIRATIAEARALRQSDFYKFRTQMSSFLADYSAAVGAGNAEYDNLYGSRTITPIRSVPSASDWEIMTDLGGAIAATDALASSGTINRTDNMSALDFVAGLATKNGLAFVTPRSKLLVPFPVGYTLELLAAQYLGDPDRWLEIAALNGLQFPYVDENGRTESLLTNSSRRSVAVGVANQYYIGQSVWLAANGIPRERRRIVAIDVYESFQNLTLDGEGDLTKFTVALESEIFSYTPYTVNSLQFLYIPSSTEPEDFDWQTKDVPGIDYFDNLIRIGGVDIQVDDFGDLVIVDGNTRLAAGLTNLIQQVRIGVGTPQGSLPRHPEFGFGVIPGTSTADVSATQVLTAAKTFVQNHPAFSGVEKAAVIKDGNSMVISMSVGVRGLNKNIPITVAVQ